MVSYVLWFHYLSYDARQKYVLNDNFVAIIGISDKY